MLALVGATAVGAFAVLAVMTRTREQPAPPKPPGIERLDPALDRLVASDATIEVLAGGYEWVEGPLWVKEGGYLLFSDVPRNAVHRWKQGEGASLYLTPSGYTGSRPRGGELGSNGLALDRDGRLVLAQHGDRRVVRMDAPLDAPQARFTTLADRYGGARLNSPNDVVVHGNGDLYFTDPAYGLEEQWEDPGRELPFAGVFRRAKDGAVALLTRDLTRPNGLAFSPDERRLYVAQSDPEAAVWRVFDVRADGGIENGRVLFDATELTRTRAGLPDGLEIDVEGNLFAAGPGGVLVLTPEGKHLGTILTGQATSNCVFGDDGHTLYMTADDYLMRVRLRTKGHGF